MTKLHPEVKIEIKAANRVGHSKDAGHSWNVSRNGKFIGVGWAAGDIKEALEDAVDDLRMLGLVTED